MTADESWNQCIIWFELYADDPAYAWAASFPGLLGALKARPAASGLYIHRWATTAVVSRFGACPDWQIGPKVELHALPGGRLEVVVFDWFNRRLERFTLREPVDPSMLDSCMTFVAGEST